MMLVTIIPCSCVEDKFVFRSSADEKAYILVKKEDEWVATRFNQLREPAFVMSMHMTSFANDIGHKLANQNETKHGFLNRFASAVRSLGNDKWHNLFDLFELCNNDRALAFISTHSEKYQLSSEDIEWCDRFQLFFDGVWNLRGQFDEAHEFGYQVLLIKYNASGHNEADQQELSVCRQVQIQAPFREKDIQILLEFVNSNNLTFADISTQSIDEIVHSVFRQKFDENEIVHQLFMILDEPSKLHSSLSVSPC